MNNPASPCSARRVGTALVAVLTLAGCAGWFERKDPVSYVPYEVRVPIEVPCAAEIPLEPDWATKGLRKADSLDEKAKALLAEREQHRGYEAKLEAATAGCR